jgi:hypothetical protein
VRIDLINPNGRDAPDDYTGGVPSPGAPGHAPVSYWGWPAATGGRFHQRLETVTPQADAVIVLLRWRGRENLRAVRQLKARGLRVFVSWKEAGSAQIAGQLGWFWRRSALRATLAAADGALATTEPGLRHYRDYGAAAVHFLPTPYPFDVPGWDFALPLAQRAGIVVGTRQFDVPARRHAEALQLAGAVARQAGCPLSVFNFDGSAGRKRIAEAVGEVPTLRVLEQRLPYPQYLGELARHRLVLQRDAGWVPGQVAGDALLCGIVNVGGNGAVQRMAFPDYAEPEANEAQLAEAVVRLLTDEAAYKAAAEAGRERARQAGLSFAGARQKLAEILAAEEL